jgi:hypothetical protein
MADEGETAAGLLGELQRRHAGGELLLELDYRRLSQLDSPVAIEAESNRLVYAGLALAAGGWWFFGAAAGLAIALLGLLGYLTLGKADIRRRTARRVHERALDDVVLWRKLWRFGGIALVEPYEHRRCAAPEDNWMQFVRERRARDSVAAAVPPQDPELSSEASPTKAGTG